MHSLRGPQQAFAVRVLADLGQGLADGAFDALGGGSGFAALARRRADGLIGAGVGHVVVATLDLLDYLADVRLEIEPVSFDGLVGGHGLLLRSNPTPHASSRGIADPQEP